MIIRPQLILLVIWAILAPMHRVPAQIESPPAPYKANDGPWRVQVIDQTWRDAKRTANDPNGREVPVRIYLPRELQDAPKDVHPAKNTPEDSKHPIVVFSHGLGGSRDGYEYFGRHLASHGYLVIHPQHLGSDTPAMRELLRHAGEAPDRQRAARGKSGLAFALDEGTSNPDNLVNRPLDISFVLDEIPRHSELAAIADLSRIAVAGHSFGSYTSMAIAGMTVNLPEDHGGPRRSFRDRRVKAIIAMSPQGPGIMGIDQNSWDAIRIPVLIMTGSKDMGQGSRAVEWRLTPFEKIRSSETGLLYIEGATHMTFSGANSALGVIRGGPRDVVKRHLGYIKQTSTAFLDATLLGDTQARRWLHDHEIENVSDGECSLRRHEP